MAAPTTILEDAFQRSINSIDSSIINAADILDKVEYVVRCLSNRAGSRMLMTCALAKIHRPSVDIRKPYTEIGDADAFSGRNDYDEAYVWPFAHKYRLPVNSTTAFLTPGFRTIGVPLALPLVINGRPKRMYADTIFLLNAVHQGQITADDLLAETIRQLLILKNQQETRMQQLLDDLKTTRHNLPLSSEGIVNLIEQHLNSPKSSRLPVLIVTAAYQCASIQLGEQVRTLYAHNAADSQTGAVGDVEITLVNQDQVVTCYEMKAKDIVQNDIELAVKKITASSVPIDNYIFITTGKINLDVADYAASLYQETGGIEFMLLDCIDFLRHFLHLFHRLRLDFLETYQQLVLGEPDSAVSQPLKELFLALRRAAEVGNND